MKEYKPLIAGLMALLVLLLLGVCEKNKNEVTETFSMHSTTKEEITDELVTALFIEEITNEIMGFYSEYYAGEIAVYNYEASVVDIGKKEPGFIFIKFGITPQIGAHNPLGYDELSYRIDSRGNGEMVKYEHLKNYEVPERFQKYIIKPLP